MPFSDLTVDILKGCLSATIKASWWKRKSNQEYQYYKNELLALCDADNSQGDKCVIAGSALGKVAAYFFLPLITSRSALRYQRIHNGEFQYTMRLCNEEQDPALQTLFEPYLPAHLLLWLRQNDLLAFSSYDESVIRIVFINKIVEKIKSSAADKAFASICVELLNIGFKITSTFILKMLDFVPHTSEVFQNFYKAIKFIKAVPAAYRNETVFFARLEQPELLGDFESILSSLRARIIEQCKNNILSLVQNKVSKKDYSFMLRDTIQKIEDAGIKEEFTKEKSGMSYDWLKLKQEELEIQSRSSEPKEADQKRRTKLKWTSFLSIDRSAMVASMEVSLPMSVPIPEIIPDQKVMKSQAAIIQQPIVGQADELLTLQEEVHKLTTLLNQERDNGAKLVEENRMAQQQIQSLESRLQLLQDEHGATQLKKTKLEEKIQELLEENRQLKMQVKTQHAEIESLKRPRNGFFDSRKDAIDQGVIAPSVGVGPKVF